MRFRPLVFAAMALAAGVLLLAGGATAAPSADPEALGYAEQLARLRIAPLKHIHGKVSENQAGEIRRIAIRDIQVRLFFYRKAVKEGFALSRDEFARLRGERVKSYYDQESLDRILKEEDIPSEAFERLLEIEFLALKYTDAKVLPGIRIDDAAVREEYGKNIGSYTVRGKVMSDIVEVSPPPIVPVGWEKRITSLSDRTRKEGLKPPVIEAWKGLEEIGGTVVVRPRVELRENSGRPYREFYRSMMVPGNEILVHRAFEGKIIVLGLVERVENRVKPYDEVRDQVRMSLEKSAYEKDIWRRYVAGQSQPGK